MSEGTESPSLEPPAALPCQSPRPQGGSWVLEKALFFHSAFLVRPEESNLRNPAAGMDVPCKATCPVEPVLPGSSSLLGRGRDHTRLQGPWTVLKANVPNP